MALHAKVKELDKARAASEDLILSLSAEKTRMLGSSGEASETIDDLVDEYSRLVSERNVSGVGYESGKLVGAWANIIQYL